MSALKVVALRPELATPPKSPRFQQNLFGDLAASGRFYSLIDIADLDQNSLLGMIARHSVKTLVDLRKLPVFERPKFNHRQMMNYFLENRILYLEYALAVKSPSSFSPAGREGEEPFGLSIWLYDTSTIDAGWYDHVRKALKETPLFHAEVPRRALIRD